MSADEFPLCDDCTRATDPNDTGPSCGHHLLCSSCYETGDFRCRACTEARIDPDDAADLWLQLLADGWLAGRWVA